MFDYKEFEDNVVLQMENTDPGEEEWDLWKTDAFEKHRRQLIESCKNALIRFNIFKTKNCPSLLLTFYIREYLDGEECTELFKKLNSKKAAMEYSEHIDDFV